MTKYDAVLFDLDGTLTRSEPGITNCVQYALDRLGFGPMPLSERLRFIGPPLYESFRDIAGMSEADAQRAVDAYRERFSAVGWMENSVYDGIPDLLIALRLAGCRLSVASAKPQPFVEKILRHFSLFRLFDRVEAIRLCDNHADKAEIVRRALPASFARAAMVGDRRFDMEGARRMGVDAVGVSYGYGGREELISSGAHAVCDTVDELAAALGAPDFRRGGRLYLPGAPEDICRRAADYLRARGLPAQTQGPCMVRILGPGAEDAPENLFPDHALPPDGDAAWRDTEIHLNRWLDRRS